MVQIVLIGFMGAGKTAIGKQLAQKLRIPFLDTDQLIEEELDLTIPEIFENHGETFFRRKEAEILKKIQMQAQDGIISTGGGIVLNQDSQEVLQDFAHVVFLNVRFETLIERIQKDTENTRPLFLNHSAKAFQKLFTDRLPLYEKNGTIIVENEKKTIEEIANEILLKVGV
ncbi:shikimate kinase [Enterococcus sp. LJL98]